MKYRQQRWAADEQTLRCTVPEIMLARPARPRSFRAFREWKSALAFANRAITARRFLSMRYDLVARRYVVGYYGSPRKDKIALAPAVMIMSAGITFDRRLPALVS